MATTHHNDDSEERIIDGNRIAFTQAEQQGERFYQVTDTVSGHDYTYHPQHGWAGDPPEYVRRIAEDLS